MKKIIIFFLVFIVVFNSILATSYAVDDCKFDGNEDAPVSQIIYDCIESPETPVILSSNKDLNVGDGTNAIIKTFIGELGVVLSIIAVLMVIYSGFLMTLSAGDDEKIKKGKDLLKWTIIGYIGLLTAGGIISLVISTIYDFSEITT